MVAPIVATAGRAVVGKIAGKTATQPGSGEKPISIFESDFLMLLGFALAADIFSLVSFGMEAAGMGLVVTVLGAPVGVAVSAVFFAVNFLLTASLQGTIILWCFFKKIPFSMGKAGASALSWLFEQIPLLNILPFNTINLFVLRYLENKRRTGGGLVGSVLGSAAGKLLKKIV